MVDVRYGSTSASDNVRSVSVLPPTETDNDRIQSNRAERISHVKALTRAIEAEIIPRLLLVSSLDEGREKPSGFENVTFDDILRCTELALEGNVDRCLEAVDAVHARGVPMGAIFLELLAPTARRLGELWTDDSRSFTDVTIALGVLQQVFRVYCGGFEGSGSSISARRAFLVPAPAEQHTFGLFLVETFLSRAGWNVVTLPTYEEEEVKGFLGANPVDLVCLSASCQRHVDLAGRAIETIRKAAREPDFSVMVGGVPFVEDPSLAEAIGADATAQDAPHAVTRAESLLRLPSGGGLRRAAN